MQNDDIILDKYALLSTNQRSTCLFILQHYVLQIEKFRRNFNILVKLLIYISMIFFKFVHSLVVEVNKLKDFKFSTTSREIAMNLRYMSHFKVTLILVNDLIIMSIT